MKVTRRLLKALIAGNPGNYDGLGAWRYCHDCAEAFFSRAGEPDLLHTGHRWSPLPALDPEGQQVLVALFRQYMRDAFSAERQAELERFALRQGWDMAYEHQDGGGALTDLEVAAWREVIERRLEQLTDEAERIAGE